MKIKKQQALQKKSVMRRPDLMALELKSIQEENPDGLLTAQAILERAQNESNVLHDYFDWNDGSAGHKFRLLQARVLINHFNVRLETHIEGHKVKDFRVSLSMDRKMPGGGYRLLSAVTKSKRLTAELQITAVNDLKAIARRYSVLTELSQDILDLVDRYS